MKDKEEQGTMLGPTMLGPLIAKVLAGAGVDADFFVGTIAAMVDEIVKGTAVDKKQLAALKDCAGTEGMLAFSARWWWDILVPQVRHQTEEKYAKAEDIRKEALRGAPDEAYGALRARHGKVLVAAHNEGQARIAKSVQGYVPLTLTLANARQNMDDVLVWWFRCKIFDTISGLKERAKQRRVAVLVELMEAAKRTESVELRFDPWQRVFDEIFDAEAAQEYRDEVEDMLANMLVSGSRYLPTSVQDIHDKMPDVSDILDNPEIENRLEIWWCEQWARVRLSLCGYDYDRVQEWRTVYESIKKDATAN